MDAQIEELLRDYPVVIELPVLWGNMDAFQHVNNVVYFRWFESGRIAYFERLGFSEALEGEKIGPILAWADCRFRIPLTYPDTVSIGVRVPEIGEDRFTMEYIAVSHQHGRIAAQGSSTIVSYDYANARKAPLPESVRERIVALEKSNA